MNLFFSSWRAAAIGLLLAGGASVPAKAATITVTNNLSSGPGSFSQAVVSALAGDTIDFDMAWPATIAIVVTPMNFFRDLTIVGPGADKLILNGLHAGNPVFQTHDDASVTMSGVTVLNANFIGFYVLGGQSLTLSHCAVVDNVGSAIISFGHLTVDDCVFSGNQTNNISNLDYGSAIYAGGTSTISNSTFDHNQSSDGCGAVYNEGNMTIRNSTFSRNITTGQVTQGGALCSQGTVTIDTSTFTDNYSRGYGGTIVATNGSVTGSTFMHNTSEFPFIGGDGIKGGPGLTVSRSILQSCAGTLTSGGDNIVSDDTCFPASVELNDRILLDAGLDYPLADNGGPTQTVALLAGSPAIDQVIVNAASCTGTDQRGFARPSGPRCDIGAYERDGNLLFGDGFE